MRRCPSWPGFLARVVELATIPVRLATLELCDLCNEPGRSRDDGAFDALRELLDAFDGLEELFVAHEGPWDAVGFWEGGACPHQGSPRRLCTTSGCNLGRRAISCGGRRWISGSWVCSRRNCA